MRLNNSILFLTKKLIAAGAAASFVLTAPAQSVPSLINYQGRLTDYTGAPLPVGPYTVQFRLWDSPTATGTNLSGAPDLIWGQQQNVTIQSNGVFNVILGSSGGNPIGNASPAVNNLAYAFAGSNCFLGVTVTASNGIAVAAPAEIAPRQQLLAVPYALNANVAASVVPGSITAASIAAGGVQTTNIAPGVVTIAQLASRPVGTNVSIGGIGLSQDSGDQVFSYLGQNGPVQMVTNLNITITTVGHPVYVGLIGSTNVAVNGTSSWIEGTFTGLGGNVDYYVYIYRDSTIISEQQCTVSGATDLGDLMLPVSAFNTIDLPPSGIHTYSVGVFPSGSAGENSPPVIEVKECNLVAFEF